MLDFSKPIVSFLLSKTFFNLIKVFKNILLKNKNVATNFPVQQFFFNTGPLAYCGILCHLNQPGIPWAKQALDPISHYL